jgi:hypothetical protein
MGGPLRPEPVKVLLEIGCIESGVSLGVATYAYDGPLPRVGEQVSISPHFTPATVAVKDVTHCVAERVVRVRLGYLEREAAFRILIDRLGWVERHATATA